MPVETPHPQYSEMLPRWIRMQHVISGEDTVKEQGTVYLPRLSDQTDDEYQSYVKRAQFFGATARTQDAFVGLMFRKPMAITASEKVNQIIGDVTLTGASLTEFAKSVAKAVLEKGRYGTLVDWSEDEERPYFVTYRAESILNWRKQRIGGKMMLTLVVLKECVSLNEAQRNAGRAGQKTNTRERQPLRPGVINQRDYTGPKEKTSQQASPDEFAEQKVNQIRVLRLELGNDPEGNITTTYTVELFQELDEEVKKGEERRKTYQSIGKLTPLRIGAPLPEIPFVFHGPNNTEPEIDKPPLEDIALTNLSHYRSSADLEHGRHFTGLPTAYAAGFDASKPMRIGSTVAWVSKDANAKAAFLEFTGQGLKALETALSTKEHHMAVLGARMLEVPKREAETAEALGMKQTGESSSLATIAGTLGAALGKLLRYTEFWMGTRDTTMDTITAEVKVNTDFNINRMTPQEVTALTAAWLNRAISHKTLLWNLRQGEILDPAKTVEDELDIIGTEAPPEMAPTKGQT